MGVALENEQLEESIRATRTQGQWHLALSLLETGLNASGALPERVDVFPG